VVDGDGDVREEQMVRHIRHNQDVAATGRHPCCFWCANQNATPLCQGQRRYCQNSVVVQSLPSHAAKTDSNWRVAICQEVGNFRRQTFVGVIKKPVVGNGMVSDPIDWGWNDTWTEAIDERCARLPRLREGVERRVARTGRAQLPSA